MPRVKGGYTTRRRRKAVLKLAKGYYGSKHTLYKTAHEQVMRSLQYAFRDRKQRKREFRKLWIQRINAACQLNGLKYNQFINGLAQADVQINRKMLAELAVNDAESFAKLCEVAKKGLANPKAKEKEVTIFMKPESKATKKANAEQAKPAKKAETKKATPKAAKAEVKEETKPATKKAAPKAAPKAEAKEDLSSKTVAELKEIAAAKGVKIPSGAKKADIIELLK